MPRRRQKSLADQARALAPFLSSADIARLFGISDRTVYREAQRGWMALPAPLPCPKNSVYKWLREDVVRWLENPDARRHDPRPWFGARDDPARVRIFEPPNDVLA